MDVVSLMERNGKLWLGDDYVSTSTLKYFLTVSSKFNEKKKIYMHRAKSSSVQILPAPSRIIVRMKNDYILFEPVYEHQLTELTHQLTVELTWFIFDSHHIRQNN